MNPNIHAGEALSRFTRTGATMPKAVAAAVATRARISEQIQATHEARQQAGRRLYEAFAADTVDSAELTQMTLRSSWGPLLGSVEQEADTELTKAVATHADALVLALREVFDPLALTLTKAHSVLGNVDIRDHHEHILTLGAKGATAWAQAIDATEKIQPISQAWGSIAAAARWRADSDVSAFSLVKWDAVRWLNTRPDSRADVSGSAWDATRAGWTLHLYTRAELVEFTEAVADEEQRRASQVKTHQTRSFPGIKLPATR